MSLVLILCFCFTLMWSFSNSQLIKYGCVILFNVTMWGCYVNSLKALSSLQATVTNFATNFLSSGLAGFLLFREPLPIQVICEIVLLCLWTIVWSSDPSFWSVLSYYFMEILVLLRCYILAPITSSRHIFHKLNKINTANWN